MRPAAYTLAVLVAVLVAPPAPAQRAHPADSVRADLALLRGALAAYHPALDKYGQRAEVEAHVDSIDAALAVRAAPVASREAAALVAGVLAEVRDGHTRINPLNQTPATRDALWGGRAALPFTFRIVGPAGDERLAVGHDLSPDGALPRGTQVVTVGGLTVARWLDRLAALSPGDGRGARALRRARLETAGPDLAEDGWPLADVLAPLAFPALSDTVALTVRRPGAHADQPVRVARLTRAGRADRLREAGALTFTDERSWETRVLDGETGYLRLGSFLSYQFSTPADTLLARSLRDLRARGARRLVLDVRGVPGGTLGAETVARFLTSAPVPCRGDAVEVASDRADPTFFPYLSSMGQGDGWKQPLPGAALRPLPGGRSELLVVPPCEVRPAPADAWAGPVAVLADAHNVSATFGLLRLVRENRLAVVVGRPAGGTLRGISGGVFVLLRLPRTGLAVDLPLFTYRPAGAPPDGPLVPDVRVEWTASDVERARDPDLEAALAALGDR